MKVIDRMKVCVYARFVSDDAGFSESRRLIFEVFHQDKTTDTTESRLALERFLRLVFCTSGDRLLGRECVVGVGALLEGADRPICL